MKRDFLTVSDFTREEILHILDRASEFKRNPSMREALLAGASVGLLFDKSSTRTRVSFEVGIHQLGGHSIFLTSGDLQLGRGESIRDTARVLSRYLKTMVIRTYSHEVVEEFADHAQMPVINALTDLHHPCQALADLLTVREKLGTLDGRMAYVGDGNNVTHSLIQAAGRVGSRLVIACPPDHMPEEEILKAARAECRAPIELVREADEAVRGADVIYTDTWVSMGKEAEAEDRETVFRPYQVNSRLVSLAAPSCLVMHCLPAHRGHEITDDVLDGARSVVMDQAENRLHVQKAILEFLLDHSS